MSYPRRTSIGHLQERACEHGQGDPAFCPYDLPSPYEGNDFMGSRVFIMQLSHLCPSEEIASFYKIKINLKIALNYSISNKNLKRHTNGTISVVQLAGDKHSILGSSCSNSISCCLQNYMSQVVCTMPEQRFRGCIFCSCSKRQVLHTSVMALACDLLSFGHNFDLRIKLAPIPHPSGNCMVFPFHFLNGFFTTKTQ